MRRRLIALVAGILVVGAGAFIVDIGGRAGDSADASPKAGTPATAAVTTRDLVEREELDGTLGYGERTDVALSAQGTLTGLPEEGAVVDRGGLIAEVDGRPVRLLFGTRPLWRVLDANVTNGPDVRQLEENLVALGHGSTANLTIDDDWTGATTAAVKRWQKANDVDESGAVAPGDVVVVPAAVRIAEHKAALGSPAASGPVLAVTGNEKVVTVHLDAARRDLLSVGTAVDVELPDGTKVPAAVRSVSSTVTPPADESKGGKPTVEVIIALSGSTEALFDSSPVDVIVTAARAKEVLTVPVEALLALAEGGYAVEKVTGRTAELVAVETGAFADGFVQVTGDVAAGDKVVVPR